MSYPFNWKCHLSYGVRFDGMSVCVSQPISIPALLLFKSTIELGEVKQPIPRKMDLSEGYLIQLLTT